MIITREKGMVLTRSRLRKWWLIRVKGYQLYRVVEEPCPACFGRVRYISRWWLSPKKGVKIE